MANNHAFPTISEAPGLEKEDEILEEIRRDMPHFSKDSGNLFGPMAIVDEASLQEALRRAFSAGALGTISTMQLLLDSRGAEVDLTKEMAHARLLINMGLLPERPVTE